MSVLNGVMDFSCVWGPGHFRGRSAASCGCLGDMVGPLERIKASRQRQEPCGMSGMEGPLATFRLTLYRRKFLRASLVSRKSSAFSPTRYLTLSENWGMPFDGSLLCLSVPHIESNTLTWWE